MNKFLIVFLIIVISALSGCTGSPKDVQEYESTPTPIPLQTYTQPVYAPTITQTSVPVTPTSTSTPTPTLGSLPEAMPTGKIVPVKVTISRRFGVSSIQINPGDQILWENMDESTYTIVENDKKIVNITLREDGTAKYIFNTTGDYGFLLYDKYNKSTMSYLTISVKVNASNASQ